MAHAAVAAAGTASATTRVSDVVYRAYSTPAAGVVLISWPAFTTADGKPVAAGSTSVTLGAGASFSADLVPNMAANPAGAYYTFVFQLDDVVRTEYWLVGRTSPTTIGAVRATPGSVASTDAVNKAYVDSTVASVGAGSFVSKNGDAMTGPLNLPDEKNDIRRSVYDRLVNCDDRDGDQWGDCVT